MVAHSLCTSNIGVIGQAVNLYKLGLFESSHLVFCDYMTVFSCYNKVLAAGIIKTMRNTWNPDSDSVTRGVK